MKKEINLHFHYKTVEEIIEPFQSDALRGGGWASQEVTNLFSKSPTFLKVTLQKLINVISNSLNKCLEMEKNMSIHFMSTAAFYKGVRAVLVDKDSFPN